MNLLSVCKGIQWLSDYGFEFYHILQTLFISEQNGTIVHVHTEGNLPRNRKVESLIACITLVTAIEYFLRFNNSIQIRNILRFF